MQRTSVLAILFAVLSSHGASAQSDGLNDQQKTGRLVLAQSCGVCHLPTSPNARTYGPVLSRDTAGGNAEVIRAVISDGTPRMPAFKHYLDQAQIDAIVAYLKTVSPAAPASTPR
jgi:mono/diheme cytochrome c family protein